MSKSKASFPVARVNRNERIGFPQGHLAAIWRRGGPAALCRYRRDAAREGAGRDRGSALVGAERGHHLVQLRHVGGGMVPVGGHGDQDAQVRGRGRKVVGQEVRQLGADVTASDLWDVGEDRRQFESRTDSHAGTPARIREALNKPRSLVSILVRLKNSNLAG